MKHVLKKPHVLHGLFVQTKLFLALLMALVGLESKVSSVCV